VETGRRDAEPLHEALGVDFASFQSGVFRGGPDDGDASLPEAVRHALDQRCLGPDYREVDCERLRQLHIIQRFVARGLLGDSGIPGCCVQLRD